MADEKADLTQVIKELAEGATGLNLPLDRITPETVMAELGIDSVAFMQMMSALEDRYQIELSDDELVRLRTIGDVQSAIDRSRTESAA